VWSYKDILRDRTQLWSKRSSSYLIIWEDTQMPTIAISTLFVIAVISMMLFTWWKAVLKLVALCVLLLVSIGTVEVVNVLNGGDLS